MKNITYIALLAVLALLVVSRSAFVVDQAEQAIIVQLGEPVGDVIAAPGLHWRLPFVQDVRFFDKRLLDWDGDVSQIPTLGREFIIVDSTARWRISDPLQFLRSVQNENGARTRLDDVLDSAVRDIVSGTELEEIVRSADWHVDVSRLGSEDAATLRAEDLVKPKKGRGELEKDILATAAQQMPNIGVQLVDVRIKRINYIDSVGKQVEDRMIAERQSIAARFRSEGEGRSQEILGNMQRELRRIESDAARQAEEIRGRADAQATKIYGEAYSQDPAFYAFSKTLESYTTLGENTTLMIDAKSDFFKYLQSTATSGR
ncbi:MAG TPA: protease modulator HflC [Gammaproteobacteria bacterium]|jgi:membrane protease subunit HflC|nr:protease modulator HflC [Gammaproteobacteria bacterium]